VYLRFSSYLPEDHLTQGFFVCARRLRDSDELETWERQHLDELFDWFNDHLPIPDTFQSWRNQPNGHLAISWWKPAAVEFIRRAREITRLLEEHDFRVETERREYVGMIVYQDEHQVVAIPDWKNRP
jgi:hypothetical protein